MCVVGVVVIEHTLAVLAWINHLIALTIHKTVVHGYT